MKKLSSLLLATLIGFAINAQTATTWSADVASIVYAKCSNCHHAGAIGPFPLMSYSDAYIQASAMEVSISAGTMPPWPADPTYRRYAHERLLTTSEKTKILDWIGNGAPQGDPNVAPAPPVYDNAWAIPSPDISVVMPDYFSEAASSDIYKCFAIPTGITTDKYIKSIEIIPGNRSVVHHVLLFQDNTGACLALDAADPNPGYTNYGGAGSNSAKLVAGWVPGSGPNTLPNGFGIKLKANSALILQVHYPAGTVGQLDSTRVNIKFADGTSIREVSVAPILNHSVTMVNGPLAIPANQIKTFEEEYTIPVKATLFSVAPHMHLIAQSVKVYAVPPAADTIPLIKINDWNFNWQGSYTFQYAQVAVPGTILRSEATYNNTASNPRNPNSPPQNVSVGESTTDEMMLTYFTYTQYQPGDENILLDSALLNPTSAQAIQATKLNVSFYPNPAQSSVFIDIPDGNEGLMLTLYNQTGQIISATKLLSDGWFDISTLPAGLYIADVRNAKGVYTQKLIKY